MARYDRAFLVPYLRDICSLYMAKEKLRGMIRGSEREIEKIQAKALQSITPPTYEPYVGGQGDLTGVGSGCLGSGLLILALLSLFGTMFSGGGLAEGLGLMALFGIPGFVIGIRSLDAVDRENAEIRKRNDARERDYALEQMAALTLVDEQVKEVKKRIGYLKAEAKKINELLEQNYALNIIPNWYRDMYPAVYLYDWFSTGQSDDLDMALNTFVLEQIKDRLDVIIRNKREELLNQRIIIANQNKSMMQEEKNHTALMSKLNRMQAIDEDRNTYLQMIEANTAVDAYFSMATYLKS